MRIGPLLYAALGFCGCRIVADNNVAAAAEGLYNFFYNGAAAVMNAAAWHDLYSQGGAKKQK